MRYIFLSFITLLFSSNLIKAQEYKEIIDNLNGNPKSVILYFYKGYLHENPKWNYKYNINKGKKIISQKNFEKNRLMSEYNFEYNDQGLLTCEKIYFNQDNRLDSSIQMSNYEFDSLNRIIKILSFYFNRIDSSGQIDMKYNSNNKLVSYGSFITTAYNPKIIAIQRKNQIEYDRYGRINRTKVVEDKDTTEMIYNYYNENDLISSIKKIHKNNENNILIQYDYKEFDKKGNWRKRYATINNKRELEIFRDIKYY